MGCIRVNDLDLTGVVAILSKSLETIVAALDAFRNEAKVHILGCSQ